MLKIFAYSALVTTPISAIPTSIYLVISRKQNILNEKIKTQKVEIEEKNSEAIKQIKAFKENIANSKKEFINNKKIHIEYLIEIKKLNAEIQKDMEQNNTGTDSESITQTQNKIDDLMTKTKEISKKSEENIKKLNWSTIALQKWEYYYQHLAFIQKKISYSEN